MALSMLVAIVAAPALLGTQEAIRQSQSKEKREEHRARRCNLIASCVKSSLRSREINGRPVVLRDNKVRSMLSHPAFLMSLFQCLVGMANTKLSYGSTPAPVMVHPTDTLLLATTYRTRIPSMKVS